jgi:hypothetical protein
VIDPAAQQASKIPCGSECMPFVGNLATKTRVLLTTVFLCLAAWGLHLPSLWYGWVHYDDVRILKDHPELYGQASLTANLKSIFVTSFPREEPLLVRDVTWALDSSIFGFDNPFGYHLGNVFLHGIVVSLLFLFLLDTTHRYSFALTVGAAYSLLAVHTEAVAWIMGRKDILSALFMLLALCAQTRRIAASTQRARLGWHTLVLVLCIAGMLSKISVLTFPLVLFLHALLLPYLGGEESPGAPLPAWHRIAGEMGYLLPTLLASLLVYRWYHHILGQVGLLTRGYTAHGVDHLWNLLLINSMAFWVYGRQLLLPQNLAVTYAWPGLQASYPAWQIAAAFATVALLAGTGIWLLRRRKDLFFYYAAFWVLMVPYLNLIYIGIWVADRYLYFAALFPLAILAGLALGILQNSRSATRNLVLAIGLLVAGVNVFQKLSYQTAWRNGESLWQYHVGLPHPSVVAYENLAAYYYSEAQTQADRPRLETTLRKMAVVVDSGLNQFWTDRHQPPPQQAWYLLFLKSIVHEVSGEFDIALDTLLLSDKLRPGFEATELNLAHLYRKLAGSVSDPSKQSAYSRGARDRFAAYMAAAYRGRTPPPVVRQEFASIESEFIALSSSEANPQISPAISK